MPFPKYPEIALLYKRPEIFAVKETIATEKLHGSTFRVHFPLGMSSMADVRFGSHDVEDTEPTFPLGKAKQWFQSRPELLTTRREVIKSYGFSEVTPSLPTSTRSRPTDCAIRWLSASRALGSRA